MAADDQYEQREFQRRTREHAKTPEGQQQVADRVKRGSEDLFRELASQSPLPQQDTSGVIDELQRNGTYSGANEEANKLAEKYFVDAIESGASGQKGPMDIFQALADDPFAKALREEASIERQGNPESAEAARFERLGKRVSEANAPTEEDTQKAYSSLAGNDRLPTSLLETNEDARYFEKSVEDGTFVGAPGAIEETRRMYIAHALDKTDNAFKSTDERNQYVYGRTDESSQETLGELRELNENTGKFVASPLTGWKGVHAEQQYALFSTKADNLAAWAEANPEKVTVAHQEEFATVVGELQKWYPYDKGALLGGDALWQQLSRSALESTLRPTSLVALAVPILRVEGLAATIAANAGATAGTTLAEDLVLGETDPQVLAQNAAISGALGGVLGGVFGRALKPAAVLDPTGVVRTVEGEVLSTVDTPILKEGMGELINAPSKQLDDAAKALENTQIAEREVLAANTGQQLSLLEMADTEVVAATNAASERVMSARSRVVAASDVYRENSRVAKVNAANSALDSAARQKGADVQIDEAAQTPLDSKIDRHTLRTPEGDKIEYRGTHINDVTAIVEGKGRGTALLNRAIDQIRTRQPGKPITADLNSEGGARLFARQTGAQFSDAQGKAITPDEAIALAAAGKGPKVSPPSGPAGGAEVADDVLALIKRQNESLSLEAARLSDASISPNSWRRQAAHISGLVSGRLPGFLANTASSAMSLKSGLSALSFGFVRTTARQLDDAVKLYADDLKFVGNKADAPYLQTTSAKLRDLAERPDQWTNVNPALKTAITNFQNHLDRKFRVLEKLGFTTAKERANYVTHLWENDPRDIAAGFAGYKGLNNARTIDSYLDGVKAGLRPKNLSLSQIMAGHDEMLNTAISDAVFMRNVIDTYAKKGPKPGNIAFRTPRLSGYTAPRNIVEGVDSYFTNPGTMLHSTVRLSSRFKNTAFGTLDMGVFGVHMLFSLGKGNLNLVASGINDAFRLAHLPHVQIEAMLGAESKRVFAARHGVRQGQAALNIDTSTGTVLGLIPGLGKVDDVLTREWSDRLSSVQFDLILTPVRNRIFEGNLIIQHLLKNDITNPQTALAAARTANMLTLTSEGAQRGSRRALEQALPTSANAIRGELASFGQLSNIFLRGNLTRPERVNAMVMIASTALSIWTVNSVVSQTLGFEPEKFNPFDDAGNSWGTWRVGDKTYTIFKEKSWIRAVNKSFEGLLAEDPKYIMAAWTQLTVSKSSPLFQSMVAPFGYGFNTEGQFQAPGLVKDQAGLSAKETILNIAPFAPIMEKLVSGQIGADPYSLTVEGMGLNTRDISTSMKLDDFVKENNPYDQQELPDPTTGRNKFQDVAELGYSGLEDAEKLALRSENPNLFGNSGALSGNFKVLIEELEQKRADLLVLEQEVQNDPLKRREYNDARAEITTRTSAIISSLELKDRKPETLQDKAKDVYFKYINEVKEATPLRVLKGEDYGQADEQAKVLVFEEYGQEGLNALERSLSAGSTALEIEYKNANKSIKNSGYWDTDEETIDYLNSASGQARLEKELGHGDFPFDNYKQFTDYIDETAKQEGKLPEKYDAFKLVQKLISTAKQRQRIADPQTDALLVIWYGNAPLTLEAKRIAESVLQREIPLSSDSPEKEDE